MSVIDMHCDVISKLLMNPRLEFDGESDTLDVTLERLIQAQAGLQAFAVYIPESLGRPRFDSVLRSVDLFYRKIAAHREIQLVRSGAELDKAIQHGKIGALLTLEGADGLEGDLMHLRVLYQLGVRVVGITWNYANWAADGAMEPRGGGFTEKGLQMIQECNDLGIIMDVSHLSEKGFWELVQRSGKPFIASHSNAYAVCPHPRNLKDEQITAIVRMGGRIGINFVPWFLHGGQTVTMEHLLPHLDHICSLGGEGAIGFGSDFDGIHMWVEGLEHAGRYPDLADWLSKHYKDDLVRDFLFGNWYSFLRDYLPQNVE